MPTPEQEFGQVLQRELDASGHGQTWFAIEVARIEGRDEPYSQSAVSYWLKGKHNPSPSTVFAMEQALGLRPGNLSRILGYIPASTRNVTSVPAAVESDTRLTVMGRRVVLKVYEELVADGPDGPDA